MREYLYYSALLQLPGFLCEKKSIVEDAILAMSLNDHANKLIGSHCCTKGLSKGEKRRVTIARELITRPHLLFIDEPLYHLDRSLYNFYFYILHSSCSMKCLRESSILNIQCFCTTYDGDIKEACKQWVDTYFHNLPK